MSHLRCPLCGKNAPISSFDPAELDLDLRLVSFKGLGRGKGFEVSEEISVLGDDDFSPVVAERVLSLSKMFLDKGVIDSDYALNKLKLTSTPKIIGIPFYTQPRVFDPRDSNAHEISSLRDAIEERDKNLTLERKIDKMLLRFIIQGYPYLIINEHEEPWTIEITNIDRECKQIFINLYGGLKLDEQKNLLKRLKTKHPLVQKIMELLTKKPEKTISEMLMEMNPRPIIGDFEKNEQERKRLKI